MKRNTPEISTASLPDIIFMLLFFFMVVTVLRKEQAKLFYEIPETNHISKIAHSKNAAYLFIGFTKNHEISYQINDRLLSLIELEKVMKGILINPEVDKSTFEISMKADKNIPMKIIKDVKLALQKAGVKNVYYMAENEIK